MLPLPYRARFHDLIFTDQKPLYYTLHSIADKYSPKEIRQLDFIFQSKHDTCEIADSENIAVDALSSLPVSAVTPTLDLANFAYNQPPVISIDISLPAFSNSVRILTHLNCGWLYPLLIYQSDDFDCSFL